MPILCVSDIPINPITGYFKQKNGQQIFRHTGNIGSIGKPKDGDKRGGYVIISINEGFQVS